MKMNTLTTAAALSDQELLARMELLAGRERDAIVDLVAHLAELDRRPNVFAALGYGSLFGYCTQVLNLSEDAACNRITAARVCREFPVVLDLLASGAMTLTSVRLLGKHLTPANHEAVLARASGRPRRDIEALLAELAPQPDVLPSVRRLPARPAPPAPTPPQGTTDTASACPDPKTSLPLTPPPAPVSRPVVRATAPERYRVQFTIGEATHGKLRRLQALLRREIPDGDPAAIFDRAVTLLLETVERKKLGAPAKSRESTPAKQSLSAIRPGTDKQRGTPLNGLLRTPMTPSRYVPRPARRGSWQRDEGRCGFVSKDGRRCTEDAFIDFHHIEAHAKGGLPSAGNMGLRCWRHNRYEAERVFGPRRPSKGS
jgi:hypothetical protein